jgi:hypothetical protein
LCPVASFAFSGYFVFKEASKYKILAGYGQRTSLRAGYFLIILLKLSRVVYIFVSTQNIFVIRGFIDLKCREVLSKGDERD